MATRRPLVRAGGRTKQLPSGDTLLGLPVYVPAYQQGDVLLKLSLTAAYSLPAYTQGGTELLVSVVLNG